MEQDPEPRKRKQQHKVSSPCSGGHTHVALMDGSQPPHTTILPSTSMHSLAVVVVVVVVVVVMAAAVVVPKPSHTPTPHPLPPLLLLLLQSTPPLRRGISLENLMAGMNTAKAEEVS